jgi:putative ABC transport system ATP-binding protein
MSLASIDHQLAPVAARTAVAAVDLSRRYGDGEAAVHALRGVSLDVPAGQFAAVMGPSGSGKSTLMHLLAGLDMNDNELTRLRRDHVGFIFQAFNLLPMLTAEENIVLPMSIAGRKPDREWLEAVLERVGLTDRRKHRPSELSGGQQQRVAVARALVSEPTVLFADEPTGNLDSASGTAVLRLLREAADAFGQTIVMVTHDAHAAAVADRVLILADGEIVADLDEPGENRIIAALHEAGR